MAKKGKWFVDYDPRLGGKLRLTEGPLENKEAAEKFASKLGHKNFRIRGADADTPAKKIETKVVEKVVETEKEPLKEV